MMFSRGAKQLVEILCRRTSSPIHSRYGYSTENFISEPKRNGTGSFVSKYSSDASHSEHMNLIKKLRERTSAPIKEVKSALIDCNWDLGQARALGATTFFKTLLDELSKEAGSRVKIGNFLRVEVGEGLQRADAPEAVAQAA